MVESMIVKFLKLDSVEGNSFQPLKKFEESSSRSEPLNDMYSGILHAPIKKPKQLDLDNPTKHEPI